MALRTDITVDWSVSPRIITVASPSVTVTVQDLNDTLRNIESKAQSGMQYASLLVTAGKSDLGGGTLTGITLTLQNALLAFSARGGPTYVQCTVTAGNLLAVDSNNTSVSAISPTAFTQVVVQIAVSAAILSSGSFNLTQIAGSTTAATNLLNSSVCDATAAINLKNAGQVMPSPTVDNTGFTPTTTQFESSDISPTGYTDHYKNRLVIWRTGTLNKFAINITAYSVINGRGRFTVATMPAAPVNGDGFVVV